MKIPCRSCGIEMEAGRDKYFDSSQCPSCDAHEEWAGNVGDVMKRAAGHLYSGDRDWNESDAENVRTYAEAIVRRMP